jgi:hypothetical protein
VLRPSRHWNGHTPRRQYVTTARRETPTGREIPRRRAPTNRAPTADRAAHVGPITQSPSPDHSVIHKTIAVNNSRSSRSRRTRATWPEPSSTPIHGTRSWHAPGANANAHGPIRNSSPDCWCRPKDDRSDRADCEHRRRGAECVRAGGA